jgi:hypothetical protein
MGQHGQPTRLGKRGCGLGVQEEESLIRNEVLIGWVQKTLVNNCYGIGSTQVEATGQDAASG